MTDMKSITTKQLIAEILRYKEQNSIDRASLNEGMRIYNDIVRNGGNSIKEQLMAMAQLKRYNSLLQEPWGNGYNIQNSYENHLVQAITQASMALGGFFEPEYLTEEAANTWADLRMCLAEFRQFASRYLPSNDVYSIETLNYDVKYNQGKGAYSEMCSKLEQFCMKDASLLRKELNFYIPVPRRAELLEHTVEIDGMLIQFEKENRISQEMPMHSPIMDTSRQTENYAFSDEDITFISMEVENYKVPKQEIHKGATAINPAVLSEEEVVALLKLDVPQKQVVEEPVQRASLSDIFETLSQFDPKNNETTRNPRSRDVFAASYISL